MNKIKLYKDYSWNETKVYFDDFEIDISDLVNICTCLENHKHQVTIDNKTFDIIPKESRLVDLYFEIAGMQVIIPDFQLLKFIITNKVNLDTIKKFEYDKCTWLILDVYLAMYDDEFVRYGVWFISDILEIDATTEKTKNLKMGRFKNNAEEYPDNKTMQKICKLEGQGVSMGFYKKEFHLLQNKIRDLLNN